jgi:hypothetical protein
VVLRQPGASAESQGMVDPQPSPHIRQRNGKKPWKTRRRNTYLNVIVVPGPSFIDPGQIPLFAETRLGKRVEGGIVLLSARTRVLLLSFINAVVFLEGSGVWGLGRLEQIPANLIRSKRPLLGDRFARHPEQLNADFDL